jgi:hypothetical protein
MYDLYTTGYAGHSYRFVVIATEKTEDAEMAHGHGLLCAACPHSGALLV